MFNIRFIVAILVVFIFVINVNGQVNDLKLTRLFLKVHKERLAEEALEEASLKEPGEHNHDLSEILNQLDNNPAIQQQFQQFQQNGLPPQLFQQQQQQQLPPRMFQQQPPQMQQQQQQQQSQQQPKPNPFVNARLPQSQQPQVQNNNNRVPQSIQQQQQQQQQQLMFQNQPTNAFGVQPQQLQQQAQPTMQRQVQQPIVQSQRQQPPPPPQMNLGQQPVRQVVAQPPMVQPQQQQQQQQQPQNLMNNFNKFTSNSQSINNFAMTGIKVAERLLNTVPTNPNDPTVTNLNDLSKLKAPARFCPFKQQQQTKCDPQFPYRSLDGSCNNLNNFWWGRAESPFKRFLDPDYSDRKYNLFFYK
jgi:hypothetical protein